MRSRTNEPQVVEIKTDNSKNQSKQDSSVVRQSACRVTAFSSQYGGEESAFAYTAQNLAGETRIHPRYGDCSHAAVFRTFDRWWHHNSLLWLDGELDRSMDGDLLTDDFIQLLYTTPVFLKAVEIYETFNASHVVRVYAGFSSTSDDIVPNWVLLWSGKPDLSVGKTARAFVPPLQLDRLRNQPVNAIRLETCSQGADYYPELDAVYIHGTPVPNTIDKETLCHETVPERMLSPDKHLQRSESFSSQNSESTVSTISRCDLAPVPEGEAVWCQVRSLLRGDGPWSLWSIEQALIDMQRTSLRLKPSFDVSGVNLDSLPHELIYALVRFLPKHDRTRTLCRLSGVSKRLYVALKDESMYDVIDLKPAWYQVTTRSLQELAKLTSQTRIIRLSWMPPTVDLNPFFQALKTNRLNVLLMSCCPQVNGELLGQICKSQPQLTSLDLSGCRSLSNENFEALADLKHLRHLSFYRTLASESSLLQIIPNFKGLETICLGSLSRISNMDVVLKCLANNCPKLRAVDCWRAKSVTHFGLRDLVNGCPHLEELDLGWCGEVRSSTGIFRHIAINLPRLRRLLLTANRTVCDADLDCLATYVFGSLEQLDILGCRDVTAVGVLTLLDRCRKLAFLDISFCASLDFDEVLQLRKTFPQCSIKKSYQP